MNADELDVYQIAVPKDWNDDLAEAIREAAAESGGLDKYTLSPVDPKDAASELQFDPVVVLLYVAKLVIDGTAAALVGVAIERLLKKKQTSAPAAVGGARIIVMLPDGEIETFDTSDAAATATALERLKVSSSG